MSDNRNTPAPPTTTTALAPTRMPIAPAIAQEFQVSSPEWRVLVETIWPNARTPEAVMMALSYCRARKLDPFKKPVHIVPMWSSAKGAMVETVWPGISEIRTTAARTGAYAGIDAPDWGQMVTRTFHGDVEVWENRQKVTVSKSVELTFPEYCRRTVYKMVDGVRCPYTAEVYWEEAYATLGFNNELPNAMWSKRIRGQLDKVSEAAAIRMAFPEETGEGVTAEEMEGQVLHDAPRNAADPLGLGITTAAATTTAPTRPVGGPPSAPIPPKKPVEATKPAPAATTARAPAERPGAQRQGQAETFPNPEELIKECAGRMEALEDGDEDGYNEVWEQYRQLQGEFTPPDWQNLLDIATAHYDRTHDDGGQPFVPGADDGEYVTGEGQGEIFPGDRR